MRGIKKGAARLSRKSLAFQGLGSTPPYEGQNPGQTSGSTAGRPCETRETAGFGDCRGPKSNLRARGFAPRTTPPLYHKGNQILLANSMGQNRCGKICSHRSANSDKSRAL